MPFQGIPKIERGRGRGRKGERKRERGSGGGRGIDREEVYHSGGASNWTKKRRVES